MAENEVLSIIERVADRYAYKFRFGYHEVEDIKQEAIIIGLEALKRYDESLPLENFLARHIRNRLITFVRDNYYRRDVSSSTGARLNEMKQALMNPAGIDSIPDTNPALLYEIDLDSEISLRDIYNMVDSQIDPRLREDFLKLLEKGELTQNRRVNIINHIFDILDRNGINREEL